VFERFKKLGLLYIGQDGKDAIITSELFLAQGKKEHTVKIAQKYQKECINLNDLLVWFIEKYPESANIMKKNPDYQYSFK
jgi:hypothetical protein